MLLPSSVKSLLMLLTLITAVSSHAHERYSRRADQTVLAAPELTVNGIPFSTRAHWMRTANQALFDLVSPCPFAAFGTAIVNHTDQTGLGELVCIGANNNSDTGNPTLHGEIAAFNNCTAVLKDRYGLSPSEALDAWKDLTLYTNAESCPMCASAVRWAGFKEYVYGTSIDTLVEAGWGQITITSYKVFSASWPLGTSTIFLGDVLTNETDPYFLWQFDPSYPCPSGCARDGSGSCISAS